MSYFYNEGAVLCRDISTGSYLSSFLQNTLKSNQVEINTDSRTLKPVAKLREPRDLFALPKELDCPQQAARWPAECQVLEERIQHIDYMPPVPEQYYHPTGREIQPKPVGDEAGTIVFQYYPMSAVNYFSRSSVGGSRFFLPACSVDTESELKFESRFESGNLAKAVKITDTYYELYLRTDLYTNRHMQWFYFRVENTRRKVMYRFSLVNLSKAESLYTEGMKPLMYSSRDALVNGIGWKRCGDNIAYFRNDTQNGDDENGGSFTLSFNLEFPHDNDTVYFAQCYPYTYSDLQDYLIRLQNHPIKSTYSKLRLLCRSLAGNNVYYLTVTAPSPAEEPKKKRAVVITCRVHPGETPASWMMKGFMDFLTGDSQQARELREKFIFKLVPMLNPDGVIVGNNRCSLTGRDLNRQYRTVIRETYPPVWHTKLMIRRLMEECGIAMYCDLHAHSRKHNVFIYGCENKRYADKRLHEQVFPLMLHKNAADKFSFENCKFRIQRSKEGTGRVVVWMMGVANSYTMEASFGGSTLGSRVDTHFTTQDYEAMGRAFCETLLDFSDDGPSKSKMFAKPHQQNFFAPQSTKPFLSSKGWRVTAETQERLRTKIVTRLVKEGSSADEPTNIELSDYSSDEGDTSSCSEDEQPIIRLDGDCCLPLPVPPPSPILPHHRGQTKKHQEAQGSPKHSRSIVTMSPPAPRKILQMPRANLDLLDPGGSDFFDGTTELESGDESSSYKKRNRSYEYSNKGYKYSDRVEMPPELIVTPAQVYEQVSLTDIERSPTKEIKGRVEMDSPSLPRKGDNCWSPERARSVQKTQSFRCDISQEVQRLSLQPSLTLHQSIWTGVEYGPECTKNVPLSWGKSPNSNSDSLLRSCSQKLSALKKSHKHSRKNTRSLDREVKPKSQKATIEDDSPPSFINKKKSKQKNNKTKKTGPQEQITINNPEEKSELGLSIESTRLEEKKKIKETPWYQGKKCGRQTVARSRFRKGGIVATATVHTCGDEAENSEEADDKTDNNGANVKKKKKKRKFLNIHRKVRKVINSVTATSSDKTTSSSQVSSSKQR